MSGPLWMLPHLILSRQVHPLSVPALSQSQVSLRPWAVFIHKHRLRLSVSWTTRLGREPSFCSCYIIHAYLTGAISGLHSTLRLLNRQHFFGASADKAEFRNRYRLTLKNLASFPSDIPHIFEVQFSPCLDLDIKSRSVMSLSAVAGTTADLRVYIWSFRIRRCPSESCQPSFCHWMAELSSPTPFFTFSDSSC